MDEKICKLFLPLVEKLYNNEPAGEPFRQPVDIVKYGCFDYYAYVKHPIDLSTIKDRLVNHKYQEDAWRFISDVNLMFSNAYLFNKKGTPVYEWTNKLNKIWNSELPGIMKRLNYCCGYLEKFGPQLLFCHGTTPERYCQIPVGAKYKCYQDQYSFCLACFNKIDADYVEIQDLSCEQPRMKLPTQPVKKSEFIDCTNDNWQYESFIKCTQCTRRVHQICELYPASENEIAECHQHEQIEHDQKETCQIPLQYRGPVVASTTVESNDDQVDKTKINYQSTISESTTPSNANIMQDQDMKRESDKIDNKGVSPAGSESMVFLDALMMRDENSNCSEFSDESIKQIEQSDGIFKSVTQQALRTSPVIGQTSVLSSLDDDLLQFARSVDDSNFMLGPNSPNPYESLDSNNQGAKENPSQPSHRECQSNNNITTNFKDDKSFVGTRLPPNSGSSKISVDNIAARLSINKMSIETQPEKPQCNLSESAHPSDNYVCNHCYKKQNIGFNLRHRKFSARRLPHSRMSRFIETKVNEFIKENSPGAGEVTIRVLTAYRDTVEVKPEMRRYVDISRSRNPDDHQNLKDYPDEFNFTNRAIFAWQEIEGVDVCVFGMHVQEYGDDCPEPNRNVVYLSYIDSVHFFRPKQVRTGVYHEMILSYFKYVKKLGFRRVFIWVCPSRKGDDYIFYRHPTEQKMPTLKRLYDWYIQLLDKGLQAGIVEKHLNIQLHANATNLTSILSLPYLSGDYWPGEFERLLNIMIESQQEYEYKMAQRRRLDTESGCIPTVEGDIISSQPSGKKNCHTNFMVAQPDDLHNMLSLTNIYQRAIPESPNSKTYSEQLKTNLFDSIGLKPTITPSSKPLCHSGSLGGTSLLIKDESKSLSSKHSDFFRLDVADQPLDLSKSSTNTTPDGSQTNDDEITDLKKSMSNKKRRKSTNAIGYTKKRCRNIKVNPPFASQGFKSNYKSTRTQSQRDNQDCEIPVHPEEQLVKNLLKSIKRQKDGFIMVQLSDCDCSPHFESQLRREEVFFTSELMRGREPFLQLARAKNLEFSCLRRAMFSSLSMVGHLGRYTKLDPICRSCYSFETTKRHYVCPNCVDYYLCTVCHENTQHKHIMSLMAPKILPDIDEFLSPCSLISSTNSVSSASSTISNKSFNETSFDLPQTPTPTSKSQTVTTAHQTTSTPLNRQMSNSLVSSGLPVLSGSKHNKVKFGPGVGLRIGNEENANIGSAFNSATMLNFQPHHPPPPLAGQSTTTLDIELDQVLIENFVRHAEVSYNVDFDEMKGESKKLLTHYWGCPLKETCFKCKFVVLSCSFMSVLMKSTRLQMNFSPPESLPAHNATSVTSSNQPSNVPDGVNLSTDDRFRYQTKEK